ncbi:ATP-binding protein [Candidatus Methanoprimaticola sp. MG2]|uniref:ATP-binding protein n=1 Tax=Candidatus Methanoprimaticola sp. MG2 TaxID=3228838 RepID=UPI0039C6BA3C
MLRRKAYQRLLDWKTRKGHKCLLVKGQRQVGKTFIIDLFARENYEHYIYMDLSKDEMMRNAFSGSLDADSIIKAIGVYRGFMDLVPHKTIIFMDEIQSCPRARESLKSFSLDGRYDVIASGSLIDVVHDPKDGRMPVLPVGYEEHMRMYSLDFEEFLWARDITDGIIDEIRSKIKNKEPLGTAYLDALNGHFRDFMIVGGMPAAVSQFVKEGNYSSASSIVSDIIETDRQDMMKYNDGVNGMKIARCLDSIPSQLSDTNKKFMYSRVDGSGSRSAARMYSDNMLWIERSGIGNYCHRLRSLDIPLETNSDRDQFRVYMSDTGMLINMMGNRAMVAVYDGDDRFNMGALMENAVAECLMKAGHALHYYRVNSGSDMMELDFVIELGLELAVIEVKSDKDRSAPSISKVSRYPQVERRIMFERGDVHVDEDGLEHYPLFASAFIDSMEREWRRPGFRPGTNGLSASGAEFRFTPDASPFRRASVRRSPDGPPSRLCRTLSSGP